MYNRNRTLWTRPWTRWQDWFNAFLGLIIFASPWYLVAWEHADSSWNAWLVGAAIFLVALWALASPVSLFAEWLNLLLGVWLFISPWVLDFALRRTAWFAWVLGALVALFSLWGISMGRMRNPRVPV